MVLIIFFSDWKAYLGEDRLTQKMARELKLILQFPLGAPRREGGEL